jgi:hypothetical protein
VRFLLLNQRAHRLILDAPHLGLSRLALGEPGIHLAQTVRLAKAARMIDAQEIELA